MIVTFIYVVISVSEMEQNIVLPQKSNTDTHIFIIIEVFFDSLSTVLSYLAQVTTYIINKIKSTLVPYLC